MSSSSRRERRRTLSSLREIARLFAAEKAEDGCVCRDRGNFQRRKADEAAVSEQLIVAEERECRTKQAPVTAEARPILRKQPRRAASRVALTAEARSEVRF